MTSETGIITGVTVNTGAYVDGTDYEYIYSTTTASGLKITDFYGDKAYFRKAILDSLKDNSITPYIPVSASAYKINEDLYSYTKDSDTWSCVQGNETYKKKSTSRMKQGKEWHGYKYYFNREQCRKCPRREECIGKATAVGKLISSKKPKKSATDPISAADLKLFIVIYQIQGDVVAKTATFSVVSNRPFV